MQRMEDEQLFKVGTKVEVTSNEEGFKNSWYKCRIVNPPKSKNTPNSKKRKKNFYWVEYESIFEEEDLIKPLKEHVDASCIRPLAPTSSACTSIFEEEDFVEADYRDGRWIGVVKEVIKGGFQYLVAFASPYEEIVFSRDKLRAAHLWLGGKSWIRLPKKNLFRCPRDADESIGALQLKSIIAEVSAMERTPSPAKRPKQATSGDAEGRQSSGQKHAVQALPAPPLLRSCQLSSQEGNANSNRKMKVSDRDSCFSMILSPNNIEGKKKKNDGTSYKKKRRGPAKKEVQRFLELIKHGEEPGESDAMHESAIEQSPTSAGIHCRRLIKEVQVTEIVDDISEVVDEQGGCQSMALVAYSNPALTELSKSHPAALDVDSQADMRQSWPFTKRSSMWKVIESMEVFKRFPQFPHFSPLNEHEENSREMSAIHMMMRFTYEVERITTGFPDDLQSTRIIHDSLENLKELESHGFSTTTLQVYLNELLIESDREKELQEKLEVVENRIRRCLAEITEVKEVLSEAADQMKHLRAQIKQSETVKNHKEKQIAHLESLQGVISGELHHLRLTKRTPPFEW